ncbi:hypothetical protein E4U54_004588 [Claviceps lovelessii]|nr:hypothetical protein E4U54_004588 [Claviceps lovelessii]
MKTFLLVVSLLSLGASAVPGPEMIVRNAVPVAERPVGQDDKTSKNLLVDVMQNLQRRCSCKPCWAKGQSCTPYQCECLGNYGCYKCWDGNYYCQPGPFTKGYCP